MDLKIFFAIFTSVFLAELGDKTQLATVCFACDEDTSKWGVFFASAAALVVSSALAVLAGSQLARFISPQHLKIGAGVLFIAIGAWTLYEGFKPISLQ